MWLVAKIKRKEIKIFKENLLKETGQDLEFYCPKIEYHQYFNNRVIRLEKPALENYVFCYHKNFQDSSLINKLRYIRGLEYFLNGYYENQDEMINFIQYCKCSENDKGYLSQSFFKTTITNKAKFISGPFTDMIFEIIKRQKNKSNL